MAEREGCSGATSARVWDLFSYGQTAYPTAAISRRQGRVNSWYYAVRASSNKTQIDTLRGGQSAEVPGAPKPPTRPKPKSGSSQAPTAPTSPPTAAATGASSRPSLSEPADADRHWNALSQTPCFVRFVSDGLGIPAWLGDVDDDERDVILLGYGGRLPAADLRKQLIGQLRG